MIILIGLGYYGLQKFAHLSFAGKRNLNFLNTSSPPKLIQLEGTKSKSRNFENSKQTICDELRVTYQHFDQLQKTNNKLGLKLEIRFENKHIQIDQIIYRLRYFIKDSDEGEIQTYLVYREDKPEIPTLIEKSSHQKGKLYKNLEQKLDVEKNGEILYNEIGINQQVNEDNTLFLHYINNQLMGIQGLHLIEKISQNIECHFQQE